MKNFEFLKDFDTDMYTLLSEFEKEVIDNPKVIESYVTPFLEKVVEDISIKNNTWISDPYVGFSQRVDKLYQFNIIDHKFKSRLLEAYQLRSTLTHKSIEDFLKEDKTIAFQLHRMLFDIAWKYYEICNKGNYNYNGKPEYVPIHILNSKTTKPTPKPSENRNFNHCIICGKINDSKNSNFCKSCNNELEYQNEIINLKNNLNIDCFTKEDVNQIHSSMYTNQLLIELTTKNLLKKTNRHYQLNHDSYEKFINYTNDCYDMEKTLIEFLEGKYTLKQIKETSYYRNGQKSIKPYIEFYKIVENQIFKEFLNQINLEIPIAEVLEKTQININQVNSWYNKNKKEFVNGNENPEFITYNKLLMDNYLTLKRKQYSTDEIKSKLQINDDIIDFWMDSFNLESTAFKNNLQEIKMNTFLNNLKNGKSKEESLKIAEITDFSELLKNKEFESEYKKEYFENRVNILLKSLKTMSYDKALKRANISQNDYDIWYSRGKKQCLLKKDDDKFCLNFYIDVTRVLMDKYLKTRMDGQTKQNSAKKIKTDLQEIQRWTRWDESGLFIDFRQNNKKVTKDLIVKAIKECNSKEAIASRVDIKVNELNKIINSGSKDDKIYNEVYQEYVSTYIPKHLGIFLEEIKNKPLQKALKSSGLEKTELDKAYELGKNNKGFEEFYNSYLNFKINSYITQIIKGKSTKKALKNSNLTNEEFKSNLEKINKEITSKQMDIVIGEITRNRTTKQAAKKANVKIDVVYNWYLEGNRGNEEFKDFANDYYEYFIEPECEIFQKFLDKGKSPKTILKIMRDTITKEDYEFWCENNLITINKDIEGELLTRDEIRELIGSNGFREKIEKPSSIMNY